MGPVAIHLQLSRKLHSNHPVLNVLLLYRHLPGSDDVEPLSSVIVENADEYEVECCRRVVGCHPHLSCMGEALGTM